MGITQFLLDVPELLFVVLEEADIIRSLWKTDLCFADRRPAPSKFGSLRETMLQAFGLGTEVLHSHSRYLNFIIKQNEHILLPLECFISPMRSIKTT